MPKLHAKPIVVLCDEPNRRVEILHDENNEFYIIREVHWGATDCVELSASEFIKLLQGGLTHFGLANGTIDKLASKLVQ